MELLTLLVRLVEALAWPGVVLIIVCMLKGQLVALLPSLRRLKAGPIEAEFEREVLEAKAEAEQLPQPTPGQADPRMQQLLELAKVHPRSAILEAWRDLEFTVRRAGLQQFRGSPAPDIASPLSVVRSFTKTNLLTQEETALFHDLRGLRNQAAHAYDFSPNYESVLEYIQLASRLKARLEELSKSGA